MKSSESVPINSAGDSINLYTLACVADNVQYNSNTNNNSSSSTSNINGASLPPCGTLRRAQDTATSVLIFDCKNVTFEPSNNTFYPTGPNLLTNTESELELEEESSVSGIADFSMYIRDMQNDDPLLSPMLSSNGSEKQLEQDLMVTTTTVDDLNGNCNLTDNSTGNNFEDAPMDIDGTSVGALQTTLETVETLQTEPLQTNTVEPLQTATVAKMDEIETVGNDTVVDVGNDSIPANIPEPNHPNPLPEAGVSVETNSGGNGTVSTNKTNDTNSTNTNNTNSTNTNNTNNTTTNTTTNTTNSNDIEGTNTNIDANSTTTNANTNNHNNTNNTKPSSPIHRSVLNQFKKVIEHNSGWSNLDELLFMADYIEPTSKVYMMYNFKKLTTLQDSVSDIETLIRTEVKQSISKTTLDYLTAVVVHYIQTFAASMIMCNLRMGRKTVSSASYCNFAEYTRDLTMSTQEMLLLELSTSGVLLNLPTVESIILKGFMHALPHQHLDANSIEHETGILKMLYNIDLTDEFLQVIRSYAIKLIKSMGFMLKRENLTQIDLCQLSDTLKRHSNVFKLRSFLNFDMHPSL
nr:hypothetical protein HvNV113 [Heliothis virescens nudivirus]